MYEKNIAAMAPSAARVPPTKGIMSITTTASIIIMLMKRLPAPSLPVCPIESALLKELYPSKPNMKATMFRINAKIHPIAGIQPSAIPQIARMAAILSLPIPEIPAASFTADFNIPRPTRSRIGPARPTVCARTVSSINVYR